jgi:hypothetical protein
MKRRAVEDAQLCRFGARRNVESNRGWFRMTAEGLMQLIENRWLIGFVAFVVGLFLGWVIWGVSGDPKKSYVSAVDEVGGATHVSAPQLETPGDDVSSTDPNVASIEAEIGKARALLANSLEADADLTAELDNVDQAVKRANGRLKLILRSVDKAKDAD